jgi:hypothetical protein
MARVINGMVFKVANVLRDGSRIDRAIFRGVDGGLYVSTPDEATPYVRIPVAYELSLGDSFALASDLCKQAEAELGSY